MESMRLLITSWGILSHSSRRALSTSWRKITWSVAKSPRVAEQCDVNIQSINPLLGEFVGVVFGQQLVFLERPKRALSDSCLENTLAFPFVQFLPRKGNPPPG
ncbi:hypothetical protein TNCV_682451 [Trichonephila clavipes]|nr:hypothetical protein TNCV_682451 [Trichonephila clavipes]